MSLLLNNQPKLTCRFLYSRIIRAMLTCNVSSELLLGHLHTDEQVLDVQLGHIYNSSVQTRI